jgi:hypothetical protein
MKRDRRPGNLTEAAEAATDIGCIVAEHAGGAL